MREQVNQSDGFDIDFDDVEFGEFGNEPETTGDFLTRLAQKSLEDRNVKEVKCTFKFVYLFILGTKVSSMKQQDIDKREFEFVRVVKSNFHFSAGLIFLITFEVIDPYDGKIKPFQARVRYLNDTFTEYIFCRPKPNIIGVKYYGNAKTNVAAKNQRGIASGWSTFIPNYKLKDVISNVEHLLNDEKTEPMDPWYEGFEGTITKDGENRYKTFGRLESSGNAETRLVTELPIEVWTNNYVSSLDKGKENRGKVSAFIEEERECMTLSLGVMDKSKTPLFLPHVNQLHQTLLYLI
ncbi:hypothetical protein YC2023_044111 [Brassica napus]